MVKNNQMKVDASIAANYLKKSKKIKKTAFYNVDSMTPAQYKEHLKLKEGKKKSKFRNTKVKNELGDFDSIKEYEHYLFLKDQLMKCKIVNLHRQVRFELIINDVKICDYIADFVWRKIPDRIVSGKNISIKRFPIVVEDVKGMRREQYIDKNGKKKTRSNSAYEMFLLKKKLMKAIHGIDVIEI